MFYPSQFYNHLSGTVHVKWFAHEQNLAYGWFKHIFSIQFRNAMFQKCWMCLDIMKRKVGTGFEGPNQNCFFPHPDWQMWRRDISPTSLILPLSYFILPIHLVCGNLVIHPPFFVPRCSLSGIPGMTLKGKLFYSTEQFQTLGQTVGPREHLISLIA